MTTARKICEQAMRRIGELNPREQIDPGDARDVLRYLNNMMASWQLRGLDYAHVTLGLNDPFPLGDEHERGVVALLAVEITDEYAPDAATAELRRAAKHGWEGLCREYFTVPGSSFATPRSLTGGTWRR